MTGRKRRGKAKAPSGSLPRQAGRGLKAASGHRHKRATPRGRALDALTYMRQGKSLTRASKLAATTSRTTKRHLLPLIERDRSGRWVAPRSDRAVRHIKILTPDGTIEVPVRSSRSASRLASYWNAVDSALAGRGLQRLMQFRGKAVRSGKVSYPLITDIHILRRLHYAGELRFEDIYGDTR